MSRERDILAAELRSSAAEFLGWLTGLKPPSDQEAIPVEMRPAFEKMCNRLALAAEQYAADRIEALEAALRERDELIRLMRRGGSRKPNPQPNLRGSAAPDADRIGALEAALRFALEVMENYSKLDGRDPSYATPSSAIGVARATLAEGQAK